LVAEAIKKQEWSDRHRAAAGNLFHHTLKPQEIDDKLDRSIPDGGCLPDVFAVVQEWFMTRKER